MVNVLCLLAREEAAVRFEELWNTLNEAKTVPVLCAYSSAAKTVNLVFYDEDLSARGRLLDLDRALHRPRDAGTSPECAYLVRRRPFNSY
jgi:hypothetical protein